MTVVEVLGSKAHVHREHASGDIQTTCPFTENHGDGSGYKSFYVNPSKNTYHCFSCKESGTVLALLTTVFDMDMYDAIDLVNYNPLEDTEIVPYEDRLQKKVRGPQVACNVPHLISIAPPKWVKDKFSPDVLKELKVGHMYSKGNLITTFPIISGRDIVGIAYRMDTPTGKVMWFNEEFKKENYFYNQPKNSRRLCLVEGQTDTLQTITNGTKNTSGIMGSYLSHRQLEIINGLDELEEIWLAFDNDNAGIICTIVSATLLEQYTDKEIYALPIENDPGDTDKKAWDIATKNKTPYAEYITRLSILLPEDYPMLKSKAQKRLLKWEQNRVD